MRLPRSSPAYGFLAPALIVIVAFFVVPVVASLALSFTDFDVYAVADHRQLRVVGAANYAHLLADPRWWIALRNTTYFVLVGGPLSVAASLGAALLVDARLARWKGFFRTVFFLPVVTTLVAVAIVWRYLFHTQYGLLNWMLGGIGLPHAHLAFTNWAMWIVFSYVWLPFMVLPVYAALERIPDSYLEASGDLGAGGWRTFRSVVLPLALPGVVAGSIFTFSLTLGDYVTPLLVGGAGSSFIGNVVYENIGLNANVPFAAAFAIVPVLIMGVYLAVARRLGAFEAF